MKMRGFWGWFLKIHAIILLMLPFGVLTYLHKDTWFVKGADKVSIGFIMTLLFAILLLKGAFKNLDKRLMTGITLLTFTFIVWLLETIIKDLFWILICASIGYVFYLIFDSIGSRLVKNYDVYKNEHIRNQAREDYEQEQKVIRGNV